MGPPVDIIEAWTGYGNNKSSMYDNVSSCWCSRAMCRDSQHAACSPFPSFLCFPVSFCAAAFTPTDHGDECNSKSLKSVQFVSPDVRRCPGRDYVKEYGKVSALLSVLRQWEDVSRLANSRPLPSRRTRTCPTMRIFTKHGILVMLERNQFDKKDVTLISDFHIQQRRPSGTQSGFRWATSISL